MDAGKKARALARTPKRKLLNGMLYIKVTFNNTLMSLADTKGNVCAWSSTGALGFKGARKSTPYAAAKVAELLAEQGEGMGLKSVDIVIKGVGPGRESAMRSFINKGCTVNSILDATPIPFNGPTPRKPRRV